MKLLQPSELPANADRPATRLLHDEPNVRLVAFHLQPGQVVKEHFSPSSVLLQVIEGEGLFTGDGGDARLAAGEAVMYAPGEMHGIRAESEALRFVAVIAPGPA